LPLEERWLVADSGRVDGRNPEPLLEHPDRRRRMTREVIVHEPEHLANLSVQYGDHASPSVELCAAIGLQVGVVDDLTEGAKPGPHWMSMGPRRGPNSRMRSTNAISRSSQFTNRRSCVISCGNLHVKSKYSGTREAHPRTVLLGGMA